GKRRMKIDQRDREQSGQRARADAAVPAAKNDGAKKQRVGDRIEVNPEQLPKGERGGNGQRRKPVAQKARRGARRPCVKLRHRLSFRPSRGVRAIAGTPSWRVRASSRCPPQVAHRMVTKGPVANLLYLGIGPGPRSGERFLAGADLGRCG